MIIIFTIGLSYFYYLDRNGWFEAWWMLFSIPFLLMLPAFILQEIGKAIGWIKEN